MSITKQFSIQPQPTSVITSIAHIPKWKIQLMHKRKQLQKSKSEIVIPSWKIELIKKLKENSKNQNLKTDPNLPVIEENIVKVSQNIFVIRETKEKKRENSSDRIPQKFTNQKSFNIHQVVLLEDEMQRKELPDQGIVNRLKNKFNAEKEETTLNYRTSYQKPSEYIPTNRNGHKNISSYRIRNKQEIKESFDPSLKVDSLELKTPEVLTIKTPSLMTQQNSLTSQKRTEYARSRTASIDLLSPRKFKLNTNSVVKPLESVKTFKFTPPKIDSKNSNEPPNVPERKLPASSFAPIPKKAPRLPPRNKKLELNKTNIEEKEKLKTDSYEKPDTVLQKTQEPNTPKEKQIAIDLPKIAIIKKEVIKSSAYSVKNSNNTSSNTIKPASISINKTKEIENMTILQVSKQLPIIDASKLGEEKAKAYNELMANSKTFQITPKSAKNKSADKTTAKNNSQQNKRNNTIQSEKLETKTELKANEEKQKADACENYKESSQKSRVEIDKNVSHIDHDLKSEVITNTDVEKSSKKKVSEEVPPQELLKDTPESQKFRPNVVSAQSKFSNNNFGRLRSTSTQIKQSGRTFTINPGKSRQRSQAINQTSNSLGTEGRKNTFTITPKPRTDDVTNESNITVSRKPRVDQIQVVGGYVKLERSLLKKSNTNVEKKKSVRFTIENTIFESGKNENFNNNHQVFRRNIFVPTNDTTFNSFPNDTIDQKENHTAIPSKLPHEKNSKEKLQSPPVKLDNDFESYIGEIVKESKEDAITEAIPSQNDHFYSDAINNDLLF